MSPKDAHSKDVFGLQLEGKLALHKKEQTSCGSSSKAGYMHGQEFCSAVCLTRSLNDMFKDALVDLEVVPKLRGGVF